MWNGFETQEFIFEERKAFIVSPKEKPNGRMILKTEYMNAFPSLDIKLLEKGYYLIHLMQRSRWAPDEEIDILAKFVKYCSERLGTGSKCLLEGMSCGGLQAAKFAEKYPELTSVVYLDAPVLNILSMVGLGECKDPSIEMFWREIVATYGVSKSTIINFRKSPIDNMEPLIKNNIPIIMLYGNADNVVIYEENGKVLEDYYKENGGNIKVIAKSMTGHHPHCFEDPAILVEFIESNWRN